MVITLLRRGTSGGGSGTITDLSKVDTITIVKKTADELRTSTTLIADADLTLPVEINSKYILEMDLQLNGSSSDDFKFQWSVPTGSRITFSTGNLPNHNVTQANITSYGIFNNAMTGITLRGCMIETGGTAGSITLTWAPNNSISTGTSLLMDSQLLLRKLS